MKRMIAAAGTVLALGLLGACRDEPVGPTQDQAALQAGEDQASFHIAAGLGARILGSHRSPLPEGIVHYTYDVAVGPGQYDRIRLRRVVRERRANRPVETEDGVFLLAGSPQLFEPIFMEPLISPVTPWDQSVAVFLAENDIDVWGMDYAWALVPLETTNFDFMRGWGFEKEIQNVEKGLTVARSIRVSTGQGNDRLHVLGFSYGVYLVYAVASDETQQPRGQRSVKGIIPVDFYLKTNDEATRLSNCASVPDVQSQLDAGAYVDETGVFFEQVGNLAASAPNDPSPFFDGLTNYQFLLFAGASGDQHFFAGYFDQSGTPTGLRYTDPRVFVALAQNTPPYFPNQVNLDVATAVCNEADVPFDDHLGDISVPILYIGAAGGFAGRLGYYNTTLTASQDITKSVVQLVPDDQQAYD